MTLPGFNVFISLIILEVFSLFILTMVRELSTILT